MLMLYSKKSIRKALKESEIRWVSIFQGHSMSNNDCSLCDMFLFLNDCRLCPVMIKTGLPNCEGTPFVEWNDHQRYAHGVDTENGMVVRCDTCSKLVKKQLAFITTLLKEARVKK